MESSKFSVSPVITYNSEDITLTSDYWANYKYVWGDEFNFGRINPYLWQYGSLLTTTDSTTKVTTYKDKELVQVNDSGEAVFTVRYEDGAFYRAPDLHTKSTMNYKFGYIEMRAKLPFAKNAWSAFWMQSIVDNSNTLASTEANVYNSYKSEIDVFETFGRTDSFVSNLHKWYKVQSGTSESTYNEQLEENDRVQYTFEGDATSEYHIIGMEWTETYIKMFVDGVPYAYFEFTDDGKVCNKDGVALEFINGYSGTDSPGASVEGFLEPLLVVIGTGVANTNDPDLNSLPNDYCIDWIRLYQKNPVENSTIWTR